MDYCLRPFLPGLRASSTLVSKFCNRSPNLVSLLSLERTVPFVLLILIIGDLIFESNDEMLQLIDFLQVLSGLYSLLLVKLQLLLAFLECIGELILNFLHLRYEDLLILQPFLQNPVLFPLSFQLELNDDLILFLLGRVQLFGRVLHGVEGGIAELRSGLRRHQGIFVIVDGFLLGEIGEVHTRTVVILAVETLLRVRTL